MKAAAQIPAGRRGNDVGFALAVIAILLVLFLPLPSGLIDIGLALSISLAMLVLMVALWIRKPLEFSAFPTILLIATLLRLSLNIATTRLILQHGAEGHDAAGHVIAGFAQFVMGGDFLIGTVVFIILVTVNFLVITKGATRIAEVGARFSLDAMPGKQMAIDADLSAGMIDERTANARRRELEEESAFFGAMDGASKFVRGDAIAGLIITAVNAIGGILIGVVRHGLPIEQAVDVFTRLSVGDGLVTQIPALIVSLAAGLLVSKGGTRGAAEEAVVGQLGSYPQALAVSGGVICALALAPGLPMLPFLALGGTFLGAAATVRSAAKAEADDANAAMDASRSDASPREASVADALRMSEIELILGRQLSTNLLRGGDQLAQRASKLRRNFARQYGLVIPDIRLGDDVALPPKRYELKLHGTMIASGELRFGEVLVVVGDGPKPDIPCVEVNEPAFGMRAVWLPDVFADELRRQGFAPIDTTSVLLTHIAEVIRGNLAQLLTYKAMRVLIDRLEPEYRKLFDEIVPSHISQSGLQAVLRQLLTERISIRNLAQILEGVAEVAPFTRKIDTIAEHVRGRIAQQICGDIAQAGVLKVVRLGARWETAFHQALKRDGKGDVVEFDIDPRLVEQFGADAALQMRRLLDDGHQFCVLCASATRPYVRMVLERMFPMVPILSHGEVVRGVEVQSIGTIA